MLPLTLVLRFSRTTWCSLKFYSMFLTKYLKPSHCFHKKPKNTANLLWKMHVRSNSQSTVYDDVNSVDGNYWVRFPLLSLLTLPSQSATSIVRSVCWLSKNVCVMDTIFCRRRHHRHQQNLWNYLPIMQLLDCVKRSDGFPSFSRRDNCTSPRSVLMRIFSCVVGCRLAPGPPVLQSIEILKVGFSLSVSGVVEASEKIPVGLGCELKGAQFNIEYGNVFYSVLKPDTLTLWGNLLWSALEPTVVTFCVHLRHHFLVPIAGAIFVLAFNCGHLGSKQRFHLKS